MNTGHLGYSAYTSKIDDFHRRAAAERRAAGKAAGERRGSRRIATLIHARRNPLRGHHARTA